MPVVRKRFGQHFLEAAWVRKLIEAIRPQAADRFVEIGSGRGALTRPLAAAAARLLAIEIDRELAADLAAGAPANVAVIAGDFLEVDLPALVAEHLADEGGVTAVRVAGNLPYNVSSPILFRLFEWSRRPGLLRDATLMLQREVADRLTARPGTREYGVLAILASLYADSHRLLDLPPGAFRPPPKVRSALVRLAFRPAPVALTDPALFEAMVRALFGQRRKMLANALKPFASRTPVAAGAALAAAGLDGRRRPETLQLAELARLSEIFASALRRAVL